MLNIERRIKAFAGLGKFMDMFSDAQAGDSDNELYRKLGESMEVAIRMSFFHNGWFSEANVRNAFAAQADALKEEKLREWLGSYPEIQNEGTPKRVGVIMAGNVPMVGFHDMLCVLISGNIFVGKLSSDDKLLMPRVAEALVEIEPAFRERIIFTEARLPAIDAIIATGSNNSARYFDYYFSKYPNIIRKNRHSVAVLDGSESEEELRELGKDIFSYYGLGCRSVSKVFIPEGYDLDNIFKAIFGFRSITENNKYSNNYDYNKTVYLMNGDSLIENGFILFKEDTALSSPVATLFYEYYKDDKSLQDRLNSVADAIQCIVSKRSDIKGRIGFGMSQCPQLWDYADGVDTMEFLLQL